MNETGLTFELLVDRILLKNNYNASGFTIASWASNNYIYTKTLLFSTMIYIMNSKNTLLSRLSEDEQRRIHHFIEIFSRNNYIYDNSNVQEMYECIAFLEKLQIEYI